MKRRIATIAATATLMLGLLPVNSAQAAGPFGQSIRTFYVGPGAHLVMDTWLNIDYDVVDMRGYGTSYSSGNNPSVMSSIENRVSIFKNGLRVQSGNVGYSCGNHCQIDNSTFIYHCVFPPAGADGYRSYNKSNVIGSQSYQVFELYSELVWTDCAN